MRPSFSDCFPKDHCVNKLLDDAHNNVSGRIHNGQFKQCSMETLELLKSEKCRSSIFEKPLTTIYTVLKLILFHCTEELLEYICYLQVNFIELWTSEQKCIDWYINNTISASAEEIATNFFTCEIEEIISILNSSTGENERKFVRHPPIFHVIQDLLRTKLDFENTKHRYPWICSLRSRGADNQHYSGVTLLKRPPGPIVLVTAAHTTFLCKSARDKIVPNCCCENVSGEGCKNREVCGGTSSRVVEMTGGDVEVVCGDWEIGDKPYRTSGEDFNVVLNIEVKDLKSVSYNDFNCFRKLLGTQNLTSVKDLVKHNMSSMI